MEGRFYNLRLPDFAKRADGRLDRLHMVSQETANRSK